MRSVAHRRAITGGRRQGVGFNPIRGQRRGRSAGFVNCAVVVQIKRAGRLKAIITHTGRGTT